MSGWASELRPPPLRPRLISLGLDYLVIACWLAVITVAGFAVRPLLPPPGPSGVDPVAADAVAFLLTVLPTWLYLTITEAGPRHATLGKRTAGLAVVDDLGGDPPWTRFAARNAVKLAPWQLAHLAAARFMLDTGHGVALAAYAAGLALAIVTVLMAVRDPQRRGLHDRVAGTRVVTRE